MSKALFTLLLAYRIKRCSFNVARGMSLIASLHGFSALNKFFLPAKKCFRPSRRTSFRFSPIFFLGRIVRACTQYYPTNFQRMSCNFRNTKASEKISLKFLFFRTASENFIERGQKDIHLAHNGLKCRLDVPQLLYLHFASRGFDFLSRTLNLRTRHTVVHFMSLNQ